MEIVRLQPCIQLQLSNKEFQNIIDKAKDWALMHGINFHVFQTKFTFFVY